VAEEYSKLRQHPLSKYLFAFQVAALGMKMKLNDKQTKKLDVKQTKRVR